MIKNKKYIYGAKSTIGAFCVHFWSTKMYAKCTHKVLFFLSYGAAFCLQNAQPQSFVERLRPLDDRGKAAMCAKMQMHLIQKCIFATHRILLNILRTFCKQNVRKMFSKILQLCLWHHKIR